MTTLIVIRHPPVLDRHICYGQINPRCSVSEERLGEMRRRLEELCDPSTCRLWSSPAERCLLVTRFLQDDYGLTATIDPRLWELSMGDFEGRTFSELEADPKFVEWTKNWQTDAPPGGESVDQMLQRIAHFRDDLDAARTHLLVAHAGVLRSLWVLLEGISFARAMKRPAPHLTPFLLSLD